MIQPLKPKTPAPPADAAALKQAAAAFEAMMLRQLIAPVLPDGPASGPAADALARQLAAAEPFGIARLMETKP